MNIRDLLAGSNPEDLQLVGNMTLIPLTSRFTEDAVISPMHEDVQLSTTTYGVVVVKNETPSPVITPAHLGLLTKAKAQDHAMTTTAVIGAERAATFRDACCIQPSMSGTIKTKHELEFVVLPLPLREKVDGMRGKTSFNKLWTDMKQFSQNMEVPGDAALTNFYHKYETQLETFIAQFEPVPQQVGAIFIINDEVVGLERVPNYRFWDEMWRPLVRGSYAAHALYKARTERRPSQLRETLRLPERIADLDALEEALDASDQALHDLTRTLVNEQLLEQDFTEEILPDKAFSAELQVVALTNDQFVGQVVYYRRNPVYVSLVVRSHWEAVRSTWQHRGQRFSL